MITDTVFGSLTFDGVMAQAGAIFGLTIVSAFLGIRLGIPLFGKLLRLVTSLVKR